MTAHRLSHRRGHDCGSTTGPRPARPCTCGPRSWARSASPTAPLLNHWWQVTLYVSPRGLTTGTDPLPRRVLRPRARLRRAPAQGPQQRRRGAARRTVVAAGRRVLRRDHGGARRAGHRGVIDVRPNEVDPAIPFAEDHQHTTYDPEAAQLFWRQLVQADRGLGEFRSHFVGQGQPGALLLGRHGPGVHPLLRAASARAPRRRPQLRRLGDGRGLLPRAEQRRVLAGRWRGGRVLLLRLPRARRVRRPSGRSRTAAYYSVENRQFLLPYEAVADAETRTRTLAQFLHTTYGAAADLGGWDRPRLEDDPARWPQHRGGAAR